MRESIHFYTQLDFQLVGTWPKEGDPSFSILQREGAELHLSSFSGDGQFGNAISILVNDIEALFKKYNDRGIQSSKTASPVHQGVVLQSWGTKEFYIDDPNGNTIRFIMRPVL